MKNKIFSLILTFCLLLPCLAILTSCNTPTIEPWKEDAINEETWKTNLSTTKFHIENGTSTDVNKTFVLHYINGYYYERGTTYENNFKKVYSNDDIKYQKLIKTNSGDITEDITESEYNQSIINFTQIIDYVKNNQAKFDFVNSFGSGRYQLTVSGSEIESLVNSIKNQMNLNEFTIDYVQVAFYIYSGFAIDFWNNSNEHILSITFPNKTFSYYKDDVLNSLTNYVIKGGPSTDDLEYTEIIIKNNEFYKIFPNKDQNLNGSTLYGKYISDGDNLGKYKVWSGGNYSQPYDYSYYYETYFLTQVKCYIGNMLSTGEFEFDYQGNLVRTMNSTLNITRTTYTYSSICVELNDKNQITKITWNLQMHDNPTNTDSEIFKMTLLPGNYNITFPNE